MFKSFFKNTFLILFVIIFTGLSVFQFTKINEKNNIIKIQSQVISEQYTMIKNFKILSDEDLFFVYYLKEYYNLTTSLSFKYTYLITTYCDMMEIDKWTVFSQIEQESDFTHNAIGTSGEIGISQILPSTANYILKLSNLSKLQNKKELYSVDVSIFIQIKYLSFLGNNIARKLLCYNQGRVPRGMTYWQIRKTRYVSGVFHKRNKFKKAYKNYNIEG